MRNLSLLVSVITIVVFASCKEIGPSINVGNVQADPDDTTYVVSPVPQAEMRNVLMEEFTGVSCPNCPAGHEIIKSMKKKHGDRIVAMGLYQFNNLLTSPRPGTDDDFRTDIATEINAAIYAGSAGSLPVTGIDRVEHNGMMVLDRSLWANAVDQRLLVASPVNLSVTSQFSEDTDSTVKVKFTATFARQIEEDVFYSIAILQDSIIDAQEDGGNEVEDYQHDHVLRGFISANGINGVLLDSDGPYEPGRVFVRTITGQLKGHWKPEHCKVVVFLHYSDANKEVLQAKEIDLK